MTNVLYKQETMLIEIVSLYSSLNVPIMNAFYQRHGITLLLGDACSHLSMAHDQVSMVHGWKIKRCTVDFKFYDSLKNLTQKGQCLCGLFHCTSV
jgi:hypothetical protein